MTQLYKTPSFSCDKPYYSLLSSISLLFLSIYLIYRQKRIGFLALIVSILSILHHCRSYSEFPPSLSDETDFLQVLDVSFAITLGVVLFLQNTYNKIVTAVIIVLYLAILFMFSDNPHIQSFIHMIIHILVMHMLFHELRSKSGKTRRRRRHRRRNNKRL